MKNRISKAVATALGIATMFGSLNVTAGELRISNANYAADDNQLIVIGKLAVPEDGQLVSLVDYVTGAVLDTQLTSQKNFQFHFEPRIDTGVPCAVFVEAGSYSASADVKHAPENCSPTPVTLTGLVVDDPLPGAEVTASVGGQAFSTQANADGYYEVSMVSSTLDDLVLIAANADNPNKPGKKVKLSSLVGSFAKVLAHPPQNVTNVTTANHALLIKGNGNRPISNVAELETAEKSVDATELLQLAAVIKLIVDHPDFDIPEDGSGQPLFDNLFDFITDVSAVISFVSDVTAADPENNALVDTMNEILEDEDLIPGFDPLAIPSRYYAIAAAAPGFMSRGGNVLEFSQDMTGQYLGQDHNTGQPIDQAFNWGVVDGELRLDFLTAITFENAPLYRDTTATPAQLDLLINCTNGTQADALDSLIGTTFTLLSDGELVDQVQQGDEIVTEYFPIWYDCGDGNSGTIELADKIWTNTGRTGLRDGNQLVTIPFTNELIEGQWAVHSEFDNEDTYWAVIPRSLYPDLVTFNLDGTSTGHFSGESNTWIIDNGDLLITYASGAIHRIRILDKVDKEYGVLHEVDNAGVRTALYDLALKVNPLAQFDSLDLINNPGQFWGGMINSWRVGAPYRLPDGSYDPASWFGWRFQAEPVGDNVGSGLDDADGDGEYDDLFWQENDIPWALLPDGRVEVLRWGVYRRWWMPIEIDVASTGERRMYVMEWEDYDGVGRRINPRINIEQEFDIIDWEYCYGCD